MNYKNLTWKKLSSYYIHKGPWATLRSDKCEMPSGHIVEDYYVLEYNNWVNAIAITEDNKILMVHQYRHAAGIISLEIPGGVMMTVKRQNRPFNVNCWKKPATCLMILNCFVLYTLTPQPLITKHFVIWLKGVKRYRNSIWMNRRSWLLKPSPLPK
jgi:hypothetical protein